MKDKHIVLGVTGGIAAYKSAQLVRLFVKAGAKVQVVMTPSAREFITPLTLSTLSQNPVITEFFTSNTGEWHSHVDLGLWADAFVVAPATACTIAKMATGVADNMLVTSYLSTRAPRFIAPAMDFDMMRHPSTLRNLATLESDGVHTIEPADGELASGLVGKGRMAEPEEIFQAIKTFFDAERPASRLEGKKVLITAGPTRERLDPVRYISNFSSGKMGVALADEAASQGAEVELVLGPCAVSPTNKNVNVTKVESALEMYDACERIFPTSDVAIMAAAVADYRVENPAEKKIKREHCDCPELHLVKNPDIAASLGKVKKSSQLLVGFALETDNEAENALGKMARKGLDMIVLNSLKDSGAGFGTDTNKVTVFTAKGEEIAFGLKSKQEVARDIVNIIADKI